MPLCISKWWLDWAKILPDFSSYKFCQQPALNNNPEVAFHFFENVLRVWSFLFKLTVAGLKKVLTLAYFLKILYMNVFITLVTLILLPLERAIEKIQRQPWFLMNANLKFKLMTLLYHRQVCRHSRIQRHLWSVDLAIF